MTDETVGVEPGTWRVHPYPKPLSVRDSDADWPKSEHGPDSLGLLAAHPAPQLSALLVLRRDPAVTSPVWSRLDLFDAGLDVDDELQQCLAVVGLGESLSVHQATALQLGIGQ